LLAFPLPVLSFGSIDLVSDVDDLGLPLSGELEPFSGFAPRLLVSGVVIDEPPEFLCVFGTVFADPVPSVQKDKEVMTLSSTDLFESTELAPVVGSSTEFLFEEASNVLSVDSFLGVDEFLSVVEEKDFITFSSPASSLHFGWDLDLLHLLYQDGHAGISFPLSGNASCWSVGLCPCLEDADLMSGSVSFSHDLVVSHDTCSRVLPISSFASLEVEATGPFVDRTFIVRLSLSFTVVIGYRFRSRGFIILCFLFVRFDLYVSSGFIIFFHCVLVAVNIYVSYMMTVSPSPFSCLGLVGVGSLGFAFRALPGVVSFRIEIVLLDLYTWADGSATLSCSLAASWLRILDDPPCCQFNDSEAFQGSVQRFEPPVRCISTYLSSSDLSSLSSSPVLSSSRFFIDCRFFPAEPRSSSSMAFSVLYSLPISPG